MLQMRYLTTQPKLPFDDQNYIWLTLVNPCLRLENSYGKNRCASPGLHSNEMRHSRTGVPQSNLKSFEVRENVTSSSTHVLLVQIPKRPSKPKSKRSPYDTPIAVSKSCVIEMLSPLYSTATTAASPIYVQWRLPSGSTCLLFPLSANSALLWSGTTAYLSAKGM